MEMTTIDFWWLTAFNAVICLFLPRIVTLDWSQLLKAWGNLGEPLSEMKSEEVVLVRDR